MVNYKVGSGCYSERLRTMSKEELSSLFYETPSSWGDRQNTPCSGFAKGLRFLNMVMTFILHPLSHYNTITEPCAQFLLSLFGDISIDFPSYFILSLIDTSIRIQRPVICFFSFDYHVDPSPFFYLFSRVPSFLGHGCHR